MVSLQVPEAVETHCNDLLFLEGGLLSRSPCRLLFLVLLSNIKQRGYIRSVTPG